MSPSSPRRVLTGDEVQDLLTALQNVPDPRRTGARCHPTGYVLAVLPATLASAGFTTLRPDFRSW